MPDVMAVIACGVWMGAAMLAKMLPVRTLLATLGILGVRIVASRVVHFDAWLMRVGG